MSLNWKELELLLSELPLEGSYIQKITEHDIHSFTFSMYSKSEKAWLLYFEIATPSSRVVRTDRMRKKSATMQRFTQYLRAHIEGRKVTNVHQLPYDRAFILTLENSEDRSVMSSSLPEAFARRLTLTRAALRLRSTG